MDAVEKKGKVLTEESKADQYEHEVGEDVHVVFSEGKIDLVADKCQC